LCGQPRTVTRNLFLALRRLRKPEEPRVMWIDALCICQENDEEKSHQVRLMGEIYKRCAEVCIWVGE
ncbi:heterokaryon incompatibility, partial [Leptodontidium sp. 2 PMI_412]